MKDRFIKIVVCLVLVGSYFFFPKYGFTAFGDSLTNHLLYPLSHANIWHLAANILCLWMIPCRLYIFVTYSIAVLCSFLPSFCLFDSIAQGGIAELSEPTYGFSGVLFAIIGISWGRVHRFRDMLWKNKWYLIIPAFLPHVNFLIHIYCLLAGYLYGSLCVRKSTNS